MIGATTKRYEPCQVGIGTECPCRHAAEVKIQGVPFCGACARKQEAYFAVGQLSTHTRGGRGSDRGLEWSFDNEGVRGGLRQGLLVKSHPEGEDLEQ